jgi:FixJ family two-component response regulator
VTLNPTHFLAYVKDHAHRTHRDEPVPHGTPILVVDDEEMVRNHVARILRAAGFAPIVASGGPDALAKVADLAQCPMLVTDQVMPEMSGDELARRLRERNPDLKVLYLTGFADGLFDKRVTLWEDEEFLEKPFTANGLLEAVALLMTGHPAASALTGTPSEPPA